MLYERGNVWWYEFIFQRMRIRESSSTDSKTIARQAELKRRRDLELSISGVQRDRPLRFCDATKHWLNMKPPSRRAGFDTTVNICASWKLVLVIDSCQS